MCCEMDSGLQRQEGVLGNKLRMQFGAAVQSLQWSYSIFWSLSSEGELEWGDGFYNGDIKTRKTVLPVELSAEKMGLQRSQQLRDLYENLSMGEIDQHAKRPSAALSPEDLSEAEWFYMVCMSFVFPPDQGLPGRAFAEGRHIWLCDAQYADSKEFTRSLLAKSAGIQTVVCFPRADGVLEFGVNELVAENPSLVQHILTLFLEVCKPACSEQSTFSPRKSGGHDDDDDDDEQTFTKLDSERVLIPTEKIDYVTQCNQFSEFHSLKLSVHSCILKEETNFHMNVDNVPHGKVASPGHGSNENHSHQPGDKFMLDEMTDAYQVQNWIHAGEETSEGAHVSINSSDCISQSFVNNEKLTSIHDKKLNQYMQELRECTHTKFKLDASENDNSHYSRTLSAILCNLLGPKPLVSSRSFSFKTSFSSCGNEFGFSRWRKGASFQMRLIDTPQKLLKKTLFDVGWMHQKHSLTQKNPNPKGNELKRVDDSAGSHQKHSLTQKNPNPKGNELKRVDDSAGSHILSEQRRKEKLNEQFFVLRSLVPSMNKFLKLDRASLLGDTILYLKELERRVEELESFKETVGRKRCPDVTDRTSDNYACNGGVVTKKACTAERNDSYTEPKSELQWVLCEDGTTDVMVTVNEEGVAVEIQCPWRECLLLEILQVTKDFHFDVRSVESSTSGSILKLSLKAKLKKPMVPATEDIKRALRRIVSKC